MIIHRPELARAAWRASSYSGNSGNCVEVADISGGMAVRDSRNPNSGELTFPSAQWAAFTSEVKAGRFE